MVPNEGRYGSKNAKQGQQYRDRYIKDATFEALKLLEPIAEKHKLTLLEIALRWLRHHSKLNIGTLAEGKPAYPRDGVIVGVSSFEQLQGNLDDLEKGPLPEDVVEALDQAWMIAKATTPNYWHLALEYSYDTQKALFGQNKQMVGKIEFNMI